MALPRYGLVDGSLHQSVRSEPGCETGTMHRRRVVEIDRADHSRKIMSSSVRPAGSRAARAWRPTRATRLPPDRRGRVVLCPMEPPPVDRSRQPRRARLRPVHCSLPARRDLASFPFVRLPRYRLMNSRTAPRRRCARPGDRSFREAVAAGWCWLRTGRIRTGGVKCLAPTPPGLAMRACPGAAGDRSGSGYFVWPATQRAASRLYGLRMS